MLCFLEMENMVGKVYWEKVEKESTRLYAEMPCRVRLRRRAFKIGYKTSNESLVCVITRCLRILAQ